ncbi:hypothetical protein GOP47_0025601 [Adiantum capillus-veneris]|uniref:Transmembrane and coiled-coil domain-containing protein 4 n=1 Tax=Adiantum capillus-veneris TaxID=13818 RepID=A0A9D4U0Z8_ADICA|nr:hypothetical protein GOP47_0025601 [Adiantum capillus-veneris]
MAELQPVHRYAAGALLSLALHQAQVHQGSLPCQPDGLLTEPQHCSIDSDHKEKTDSLWTSQHTCLLRPIFRFLKIDAKAWVGLEQTAISMDAKLHLGAFLRILSDDEDCASSSNTAEIKLSEAVDNLALKFENISSSVATSQENSARHSEVSDAKGHKEGILNEDSSRHACKSDSTILDASQGPGKLSLLKEDYFASSPSRVAEREADLVEGQRECEGCSESAVDIETVGRSQSLSVGDDHILKDFSPTGSLIAEGRFLTQRRKVAVLFELLSAVVADIPTEDGKKASKTRRGYDARQRVALRLLATWLDVKWNKVAAMEVLVAYSAMAAQEDAEENKDEKEKEVKSWAKWKRGGLIGAAAVTGGALLALTGGLAAPAIAAGLSALAPTLGTIVPVIGSTGFAAAAAVAGSTAGSVAVAASFGAAGAGLTGSKMARRTGGVEEFGFEGLGENHQQGRLAVGIAVSGFLNDPEDFTKPWRGKDNDLEMYALRWETKTLLAVSTAIQDWLTSNISKELMKQGAMLTVLSTLLTALAWPTALLSLTDFIDSKWTVAVDRSDKAGKLLADVLLRGLQGNRPVTLMGFSLGARVIFKCLEKLAEKGENGRIVERVVLLGAPLSIDTQRWKTVRQVVAGRFINAYSTNDWLLAVVYRASLMSQGIAGIQPVDVPGIENIDVTDLVNGHSSYLSNVGEILKRLDLDSYFPTIQKNVQNEVTLNCK